MKELLLKNFLEERLTADELDADIPGTLRRNWIKGLISLWSKKHFWLHVDRMESDFQLRSAHLIKLIDAVSTGSLKAKHLSIICDVLDGGGSSFQWDQDTAEGARVGNVVSWLSWPKANYPLTPQVLTKMRQYLETGENTITIEDTRTS